LTETPRATAPFRLQHLDHLVLRTGDVGRLVKFYRLLGCTIVREVQSMGMVQLRSGESMIDIVHSDGLSEADERGRNLDHFALRVEPFVESEILAFCADNQIEAEPMANLLLGADGYGPAVYLRDPDGNKVELKGPPQERSS
jgi:catechol-2,3-dioxygenase